MNEKEKMLKQVQMYCFALVDASLFLDTHPTDKEALKYYQRLKEMSDKLQEEYQKKYGSLNIKNGEKDGKWEWATSAFPWEVQK